MHHAAAFGDVDEVFRLLEGCIGSHVRNCNRTAHGVNPDAKESAFGKTPLHRAAEHDRYDVAVELMRYNASVNVTDKRFWTPLHKTAEKGWLEFSRLLIQHRADVGAVDKYGWTPLHRACDNGRLAVAQLLHRHGADLDHGRASLGHFHPDVHAYANQDGTPLHAAARRGHADVVRWLIASGADIDARDKFGYMPLHRAAEAGQLEAARALLEGGAQKNARGLVGGTPLTTAHINGHLEVAEALARAGCTTTTPLGEGSRSVLPTQSKDYGFAHGSEWVPPIYGGNGLKYVDQDTDTYTMYRQPGLPSVVLEMGEIVIDNAGGSCAVADVSLHTAGTGCVGAEIGAPQLDAGGAVLSIPILSRGTCTLPPTVVFGGGCVAATAATVRLRPVPPSLVDESTGVRYTDEQHVGPEIWVPGATDANPDAGAQKTYTFRTAGVDHTIQGAVDVTPDPMSSHILHTSSATDHGMRGDLQVQPGAPHIDDGYRSDSYRPHGMHANDVSGFSTGGVDLGSRTESRTAEMGPRPGVEIGPTSEIVQGRRRRRRLGATHGSGGGGGGGTVGESLAARLREKLRLHVAGASDASSRQA
eukprot:COSAG01_NODE_8466_length_2777_cov_1.278940_2_plen_588_part_00